MKPGWGRGYVLGEVEEGGEEVVGEMLEVVELVLLEGLVGDVSESLSLLFLPLQ